MVNGVAAIPLSGEVFRFDRHAPGVAQSPFVMRWFLAGRENRLAAAAVESVLSDQPARYHPLVLIGPAGVGKSHLALGLARQWQAAGRPGIALAVTGGRFSRELGLAIAQERMDRFRDRYRGAALLVLEDLGQLGKRVAAQQELLFTLDALHDSGGVAIVTSRSPICEIPEILPGLQSRLAGGLLVNLRLPEAETRAAILLEMAAALRISLEPEAAALLAREAGVGAAELLQLLIDLGGRRRAIDSESVAQLSARRRPDLKVSTIAAATAKHFSLDPAALKGAGRSRTVADARGVAMYLARSLSGHTLQKIGRWFGGRDHTTVLYNCRKIEKQLERDANLRQTVTELKQRLKKREPTP